MEHSQDSYVLPEEVNQEERNQQKQPKENAFSEDSCTSKPGQSQFSYLFNEQEEQDDPYDFAIRKVNENREELTKNLKEIYAPPQPPVNHEISPKKETKMPMHTIERDLTLEEPREEKKSLKESFAELLQKVKKIGQMDQEKSKKPQQAGEDLTKQTNPEQELAEESFEAVTEGEPAQQETVLPEEQSAEESIEQSTDDEDPSALLKEHANEEELPLSQQTEEVVLGLDPKLPPRKIEWDAKTLFCTPSLPEVVLEHQEQKLFWNTQEKKTLQKAKEVVAPPPILTEMEPKQPDSIVTDSFSPPKQQPIPKKREEEKGIPIKPKETAVHTQPPPSVPKEEEDLSRLLRRQISAESKRIFFRCIVLFILGSFLALCSLCERFGAPLFGIFSSATQPRSFAILHCIGVFIGATLCAGLVRTGLLGFIKGKKASGADGAFAMALIACGAQALVACFIPEALQQGAIRLYVPIALLGLCGNQIGKLSMLRRIRKNHFLYTTANPGFVLAHLEEESRVQRIVDASIPDRMTVAATQTDTEFPLLASSLEADSSEQTVDKFITVGIFIALIAAALMFFTVKEHTFSVALAAYTAICCLCAPFTATAAVNFPMGKLCRHFRKHGMIAVNWRAAEHFGETGCVVLKDEELFPENTVILSGIKTLSGGRIDDAILDAASLLREAGGPMRTVFQRVVRGQSGILPKAEQITAEESGFSGWVQGRRILVGSGALMEAHGIMPPSRDYEEKNCPEGTIPIYVARGGELCALFTVEYTVDAEICRQVQDVIRCGCDLAVMTTDNNLTEKMIAQKFSVPQENITLVPNTQQVHPHDLRQEELQQPLILMQKPGKSLLLAIAGCIRTKAKIQLAGLLQTVGIILGLSLVFVFCMAGSISQIGVTEILVFELFWLLATLVIPSIKRF